MQDSWSADFRPTTELSRETVSPVYSGQARCYSWFVTLSMSCSQRMFGYVPGGLVVCDGSLYGVPAAIVVITLVDRGERSRAG